MRRLSLHASALSDAEYDAYTSSLINITEDETRESDVSAHEDAYYENMNVSIREARLWLRGRYSHVPSGKIDTIIKYFSPALGPSDTITGGQFFAVLRLIVHAESGKEVDRALAFVQAHPSPPPSSDTTPAPARRTNEPPPMPSRRRQSGSNSVVSGTSTHATFFSEPASLALSRAGAENHSNIHSLPQPPLHPSQRHDHPNPPQTTPQHTTHNPFLHRGSKTTVARSEDGNIKVPPLPPRKPPPPAPSQAQITLIPPPRHAVMASTRSGRSVSPSKSPARTSVILPPSTIASNPPKPASHVTSTLMKQSLQASKAAQTMKKAEEQLEKERVLQVLKSSSVVSGSYSLAGASVKNSSVVIGSNIRIRSASPMKVLHPYAASSSSQTSGSDDHAPPLPQRRVKQQLRHSPPVSTSSMEQVALAAPPPVTLSTYQQSSTLGGSTGAVTTNPVYSPFHSLADPPSTIYDSPDVSPTRSQTDLGNGPPPQHPDRHPSHVPYQAPSTFYNYSTPGKNVEAIKTTNLESFEAIYGPTPSTTNVTPYKSPTSEDSPTGRVFRSKSMHHPSPPPPIPPPLRRKRPESIQVLGDISSEGRLGEDDNNNPGSANPLLSRHMSLSHHRRSSLSSNLSSHSTPHDTATFSSIQRTIATLQPKLDAMQPRLDKARYKAEAGLTRRGFVRDTTGSKHGLEGEEEEGLMGSRRGFVHGRSTEEPDSGRYDQPEVDDDWQGAESSTGITHGGDHNLRNHALTERDNLKWPAGEGWNPL